MRQILYISSAPGLSGAEVSEILEVCQRNNAQRGITGFLLYNGRNFMQLLEGEGSDLRWLMGRLSADPRHAGMVTLAANEVAAPVCSDWAMRQIKLADDVAQRRETLAAQLPDGLSDDIRTLVMNFAALN